MPHPSSPDPKPHVGGTKRAYDPPRIVLRERLEAFAGVCSPSPPAKMDPGTCPLGPIGS